MSRTRVKAFVIAVDLLALAGFVLVLPYHAPGYIVGLSLLASLAVMTGTGPVRIPSLKTSVSVTDAFVFTALGAFGPMPACVVAAAGVLGSTLGKGSHRKPIHFMFNLGNVVGATAAASLVYILAGAVPGGPILKQIWPLFGATSVYVVINTVMVSTAVVVDSRQNFLATWKESIRWSAVSAYAGLTMSAFLLWAIMLFGPQGLALGVPPLWLLAAFYRTHKERQIEAQQRVSTVESANAELEDKVAERTKELQEALSSINRVNDELRSTNDRLVQADRAKSEFLANVSHELRTPLNAIIGFSDLLQDDSYGPLNSDQGGFVQDINESGEHLLRLINDILDVTKIEAGKMEATLEVFDVVRSIQDAVSMVRPQAGSKQIRLNVDCGTDDLAGRLDAGMFRQLLLNLLSNAVKFTPEGGAVEVSASRSENDLVVQVSDTGIGIPEQDLERIFDEFYQVDGSYSRNYEGTGLGLALVRRMVRLMGGEISATSILGQGSRFSCRFAGAVTDVAPVVERTAVAPAPPPRAESEAAESRVTDGRTIVVVEDNPVNRRLARNALTCRGYVVHEATTGEEALELLARQPADLILMDIQLPGMDGLEVTRRLKADPRTAGIPVVALTAHVKEADEAKARAAGCTGYITKPIRLAQFPTQVASYISAEEPVAAV